MNEKLRRRVRVVLPALLRLLLLAAVAVLLGQIFGVRAGLWFAVLSFALLLALHLAYLAVLGEWLEDPQLSSIPDGFGAWAEVFTRMYKARRGSQQTEQRLSDNEQRFRRTISALPEGIVLVDASLQIEWCNPVAERHLRIELRADQGLRLTNLVRDPSFVAYLSAGQFAEALLFRPLANPAVALEVTVIEFEPGRSIVITRDVTQTERVDAMRRDFVANVSHELRTPLTVVNGFLEAMIDGGADLDATRLHHLNLMYEQSDRMHRLVEDLLILSRLESQEGPESEEDVDAAQLVAEVADEARTLSAGRHRISVEAAKLRLR